MAAQVELGICQGASINCVCARTLVLLLLRAKRERCVPFETVPSFMSIFVTDDRAPGGILWMMCNFARLELLMLFVRMPLLNHGQAFTLTLLFPQS